MKKLNLLWKLVLIYILLVFVECSDPLLDVNKPNFNGQENGEIKNGINLSIETPDADQPLTITFKASPTSDLYGYVGNVYLHTGVVREGVWMYVPAEWNENIEKW